MLFAAGALALTSCSDDNDSNPTLIQPTEFILNEPTVKDATVDLALSNGIDLSWSQPQYTADNAPVVATYSVQVSTTSTFNKEYNTNAEDDTENEGADFITLDETTTTCKTTVDAASIDKAIQQLNKYEENEVPSELEVSIRIKSDVRNASLVALNAIESNIVKIKTIPYYFELKNADPELWYLIGGDICDGKWGSAIGESILPMQTVKDYEYDKKTGQGEITWTGYLAGNGFKLKLTHDSWDNQWGQGDAFGSYVKNDGGSGNITVTEPGYYTVTLNTAKNELKVEKYETAVTEFATMCVAGDMYGDDWADHEMSPCFTFDGAKNHDWYTTITVADGQGFKFKCAGSWDYEAGGAFNTTADGSAYGYGVQGGSNINLPAGTYLVIYNDITRFYRCILQ